jgi:glutamate:GABA antiporter
MKNEFSKQPKTLGIFSLVMINIIAIASLRSLPFSAIYGFSLVFFYILATFAFFIPTAIISAELATAWPNKGGLYVWIREAFGEFWGFFVVWIQWIYNVIWYPTILSFIGGAIAYIIDPSLAENKIYMLAIINILFWSCTIINFFGMSISRIISTLGALFGTLIPMAFIVGLGLLWLKLGHGTQIHFTWQSFLPNIYHLKNLGFFTAILFGLVGIEMSAVHADEVHNPCRAYPRAILYSGIIILFFMILGSLAIALVVPPEKLNVVTGVLQAFQLFLSAYNLNWLMIIMALLIIFGGISGVATWIIGPTKGLLVAATDGTLPNCFAKVNKYQVPVAILLTQALVFTLLCALFLLMPNVSSSYWILTAMSAQLTLIVYILMFAAAIKLRYKHKDVVRAYKVPGKNYGIWIAAIIGIITCTGAIIIGFFPPEDIKAGSTIGFETILAIQLIIVCITPFIIHYLKKLTPATTFIPKPENNRNF